MATDTLICLIILIVGIVLGYAIKSYLIRRSKSGTIVVTKNEGRTLYSLELSEYPEKLEFKKRVVFDVDASGENPDRE
jgi:hypothetical protein